MKERLAPLKVRSAQGDYLVSLRDSVGEVVTDLLDLPDAVFVVDRRVAELHAEALRPILGGHRVLPFDATEEAKTLEGAGRLLGFFQESGCVRKSLVVAIGGGITQDVSSFAAHVYYRGLRWIFVPTTLLAMADSCIGAKCTLNFRGHKNQLGVFHSPANVILSTSFLETLPDEDMLSGWGEILKLALTGGPRFLDDVESSIREEGVRPRSLDLLVRESLRVKTSVIEVDEYEADLRRILNYGHTFGHALEAATHHAVPHGQAVAWGLDLANFIAVRRGILPEEHFARVHALVRQHFAAAFAATPGPEALLAAARRDKKVAAGVLHMALLERPGSVTMRPIPFDTSLEADVAAFLELDRTSGRPESQRNGGLTPPPSSGGRS
jgi:3-dehydroquinate synthase